MKKTKVHGSADCRLKQCDDGVSVAEVCRKAASRMRRFTTGARSMRGPMPSEMRRLRQLEEENSKLKRIVATCRWIRRCFRMSWSKVSKPAVRRELVDKLIGVWNVSVRRACRGSVVDRPFICMSVGMSRPILKHPIREIAQTSCSVWLTLSTCCLRGGWVK